MENLQNNYFSITVRPREGNYNSSWYEKTKECCDHFSVKYAMSEEHGSDSIPNHVQAVIFTTESKATVARYFNRHFENMEGYNKGKKGYHDGSSICIVDRSKIGDAMFGYVMKENPTKHTIRGISEMEMAICVSKFLALPDFKEHRISKSKKDYKQCMEAAIIIYELFPVCEIQPYTTVIKEYKKEFREKSTVICNNNYQAHKKFKIKDFNMKIERYEIDVPVYYRADELENCPLQRNINTNCLTPAFLKDILIQECIQRQDLALYEQYKKNLEIIVELIKIHEKNILERISNFS